MDTAFVKAGNYFGTASRNALRGPGQRNIDFALHQTIPISERIRSELRGEMFNALNMVNFANPSGASTSTNFGKISSTTGNPPIVQLALKLLF